ncbi:hypothetical protein IFM89_004246 [Coptis chinensis]|uniref:Protein TIFY n=1 Tax=Coptis chinensis TaxID=261450 RepID=A0A835M6T9_9MAGN|nr:hypothetical protein IFM89_004246 [Coptis chinensis]
MAVPLMMMAHQSNNNDKCKDSSGKLILHDFLGSTCASDTPVLVVPPVHREIRLAEASASSGGLHGTVSATSDLGSERQMGNHFEGVPVYGPNSDFSGPETSNRFSGKKRSNSDAVFMGFPRDGTPQIGPESVENFHLMKMLRSSSGGDRPRRADELSFGMQPPKPTSSSHLILKHTVGSRPDSATSKWERSLMNVGSSTQNTSCLGQFGTYVDNVKAGPSVISPPAADEGSRTGVKGSGMLSAINATSGVEPKTPGVLLSSHRLKSWTQNADPELSNSPRREGLNSASCQMTIFYAGQAHVFDEVHPNKPTYPKEEFGIKSQSVVLDVVDRVGHRVELFADVIMALAGSNGGSWSTTYSPKSSVGHLLNETGISNRENRPGFSDLAYYPELRRNLSVPGSSTRGFNQGSRLSTTVGDPVNSFSGAHQGSMNLRRIRSFNQQAEQKNEGKREV